MVEFVVLSGYPSSTVNVTASVNKAVYKLSSLAIITGFCVYFSKILSVLFLKYLSSSTIAMEILSVLFLKYQSSSLIVKEFVCFVSEITFFFSYCYRVSAFLFLKFLTTLETAARFLSCDYHNYCDCLLSQGIPLLQCCSQIVLFPNMYFSISNCDRFCACLVCCLQWLSQVAYTFYVNSVSHDICLLYWLPHALPVLFLKISFLFSDCDRFHAVAWLAPVQEERTGENVSCREQRCRLEKSSKGIR